MKTLFLITELSFLYLLVKLSKPGGQDWCGIDVSMYYETLQLSSTVPGLRSSEGGRDDFIQAPARSLISDVDCWQQAKWIHWHLDTVPWVWCLMWLHNWCIHPRLNHLWKLRNCQRESNFTTKEKRCLGVFTDNPIDLTLRCTYEYWQIKWTHALHVRVKFRAKLLSEKMISSVHIIRLFICMLPIPSPIWIKGPWAWELLFCSLLRVFPTHRGVPGQ